MLHQLLSRSSDERGHRVGVVMVGHAFGPHKAPQPHERADGGVHRKKVRMDDRRDLSADVDFSASTKIGAHDRAHEMERKTSLDLLPRLDSHCSQIRLAKTGLAVQFIEAGLVKPEAREPPCQMIEAFPCRLHIPQPIANIFRRQRAAMFV
jgi:hypothetical protein